MKKNFLLLCAILLSTIFFSCGEDDDTPLDNNDIYNYTAMNGDWSWSSTGSESKNCNVKVAVDQDSNTLTIYNFQGFGDSQKVKFTINGLTLTMEDATINSYFVSNGVGLITSNLKTITFEYYITDGTDLGETIKVKMIRGGAISK